MLKYDLTDLGYKYKGAATVKSKDMEVGPWNIIDIPEDIDSEKVKNDVKRFLNKICAVEIPTSLKCNLRCKYCYINDPRMKNKDVSKSTVTRILQEMSEMFPGLMKDNVNERKKAHLSAWGAEPFVNAGTLEAMYEFGHEHYGKGKYVLGLSTNGTILSKRLEQLIINLIRDNAINDIQISLDGPPEVQNKYRPYVNGKPSFEHVEKFALRFTDITKELGVKKRLYHLCSTIHLQDEEFDKVWKASAEFFSEPNKWYTSLPSLPMRMSGEDMYGKDEVDRFISAQRQMVEVAKARVKQGITIVDFYTFKLFGNTSCKSKNAFPFCSAINTQIGIDVDGSIYPCHGAITTPTYKPFLWFGNLFEKTISYQKLIRNIHYQFNSWNRGKCSSCPIYHYTTGSICWSCAPHNLAVSGEPAIDNIMKCKAYNESFKYWIEIAKMNVDNPILDEIPMSVDIESNNKLKVIRENIHFDRNYDGIIRESVEKVCGEDINTEDMWYSDSWWNFDNFYEECKGKK